MSLVTDPAPDNPRFLMPSCLIHRDDGAQLRLTDLSDLMIRGVYASATRPGSGLGKADSPPEMEFSRLPMYP